MAGRNKGELLGVHVRSGDGLAARPLDALQGHRELLKELGGTYREVTASDPVEGLLAFARAERATQLVLGSSHRSRLSEFVRGSVINGIIRQAGDLDIHVISSTTTNDAPTTGNLLTGRPRRTAAISRRRVVSGWVVAGAGLPILTLVLVQLRDQVTLSGDLLLYIALVVATAAIGGSGPGLGAAVAADLVANWYFTPPLYTFTISDPVNLIALVVFLGVAGVVSWIVGFAARRTAEAARSRAEAATLVRLAGAMLTEQDPLVEVIAQLSATFGLDGVSLLRRGDGDRPTVLVSTGGSAPETTEAATDTAALDERTTLAIAGPRLTTDDRRVLRAFTDQLAVALRSRELQAEAANAELLAQANELRTALLRAVSHDLRTPLSSIKASATTLLAEDVTWTADNVRELLTTIDAEADRLNKLIENLLDMSRLQGGSVDLVQQVVGLDEVVAQAVASLGGRARDVVIEIPEDLAPIRCDPALLERAIANVVDNASAWSPPGRPVKIEGACIDASVELRVIDRGPGIPERARQTVFQPFQRLGDQHTETGVGLGLAVARGFVDALGGDLAVEDTPGGGTTMVFRFRAAA